jgi:predicted nucleic acid-binding protein
LIGASGSAHILTAVFGTPLEPSQAFDIVEGWLRQPPTVILHPTDRHVGIVRGLIEPLGSGGSLLNDAHLAALAIEYGGEQYSADTDFARFPGLRWTNPLTHA